MVPRSCAIGETHVKDGRNGPDAPSDKLFLGEAEHLLADDAQTTAFSRSIRIYRV